MASLPMLLADPMRSRIAAALLVVNELCVGDLALALDATEDSVSYALRLLRTAGLVRRRREGRMAFYRLRGGDARPVLEASLASLRDVRPTPPRSPRRRPRHLGALAESASCLLEEIAAMVHAARHIGSRRSRNDRSGVPPKVSSAAGTTVAGLTAKGFH